MDSRTPPFYAAALILSTIGNALMALFFLWGTLCYASFSSWVIGVTNLLGMEGVTRGYLFLILCSHLLSLVGLLLLWKKQNKGLFVFLIGKVLLIVLPIVQLGVDATSGIQLIFAFMFSAIFSYYYKESGRSEKK
ncbi:MAG: hypothetical protein ACK5JS_04115 [Mangrovibacterium sp.]